MDFQELEKLLAKTDIIDSTYPVSGTYIWLPTGFEFKEIVFDFIKEKVKNIGYKQYQFPRLIPGEALRKVTKSIANFEDDLYWLRKGDKHLDIFLNPTGECGIYTMFNKWIRTEADLPTKVFQIGNMFRPHKHPYQMVNSNEFTSLLEAHSAYASKKEAEDEFERVVEAFKEIHEALGIPSKVVERPKWGNLPIAERMISFETYLPAKEVSFNVGVVYLQDQIYSKAFDVKFLNKEGKQEHTHQVTFGISERSLGAMLSLHSDQYGLRFLPEFAPNQIVLIPVYDGQKDDLVKEYLNNLRNELYGFRVLVDESEKTLPRKKFPIWRERGVPLRIGISSGDIEGKTMRVYSRDKKDPEIITFSDLRQKIPQYFSEIKSNIYEDAKKTLADRIKDTVTYEEVSEVVEGKGIARFEWCGQEKCGQNMVNNLNGEILGVTWDESPVGKCINCDLKASFIAYYARRAYSP